MMVYFLVMNSKTFNTIRLSFKVKNTEETVTRKNEQNQVVAMNQKMTARSLDGVVVMMATQTLRIAKGRNAIIRRNQFPLITMTVVATEDCFIPVRTVRTVLILKYCDSLNSVFNHYTVAALVQPLLRNDECSVC